VSLTLTVDWSGASVTISWPSASVGFVLQQTSNLATADWVAFPGVIEDNGTLKTATLSPNPGDLYLRLYHP
jgi:hypothetical protein